MGFVTFQINVFALEIFNVLDFWRELKVRERIRHPVQLWL